MDVIFDLSLPALPGRSWSLAAAEVIATPGSRVRVLAGEEDVFTRAVPLQGSLMVPFMTLDAVGGMVGNRPRFPSGVGVRILVENESPAASANVILSASPELANDHPPDPHPTLRQAIS